MEEAVYGDVLDVLVELREALMPPSNNDEPRSPDVDLLLQEHTPNLITKLDGLARLLEAVLPHLAGAAAPPVAATALRTLVTRKLGDVMESAHLVRSLATRRVSGSSETSAGSLDTKPSESMKARQVFRTATQTLEDAQRLLRIAYPGILSSAFPSPTLASSPGASMAPRSQASSPELSEQTCTQPASRLLDSKLAQDRYDEHNGNDEDEDAGYDSSSLPRASVGTAPYMRRSASREAGGGGAGVIASGALATDAVRTSLSSPVRLSSRGSSDADEPRGRTQWWIDAPAGEKQSTKSATAAPTPTQPPTPPTASKSEQRKVSFSSTSGSGDDTDGSGQPVRRDRTLRIDPSVEAPSSGGLDLVYFASSSPSAHAGAKRAPQTQPGQQRPPTPSDPPAGLRPRFPAHCPGRRGPSDTLWGSVNSGGGGAASGGSGGSPIAKPVVNPDGSHTTRHTQRLPGELWRSLLRREEPGIHAALRTDVMDLFNYGEETPQIVPEAITDVALSFINGFLQVAMSLTHRASLTAADIDMRLGLFSFPELTSLYQDHAQLRRQELQDEAQSSVGPLDTIATRRDSEVSATSMLTSLGSGTAAVALADYRWPGTSAGARQLSLSGTPATSTTTMLAGAGGPHRRGSTAADDSSSSERTLSIIPENSPVSSLTPTSAAALYRFQQQHPLTGNAGGGSATAAGHVQSSHHRVTIPGPHWSKVTSHVSERVCRLLVVDEIASALNLPSTAVERVEFGYGSLIVDFDLFAAAGDALPPAALVNKILHRYPFPVLQRVYSDTCDTLGLDAAEPEPAPASKTRDSRGPPRPAMHFTLPDKDVLDRDSDDESIRRRRGGGGGSTNVTARLPEPEEAAPLPSPPAAARRAGRGAQKEVNTAAVTTGGAGDSPDARPRLGAPPRPFTHGAAPDSGATFSGPSTPSGARCPAPSARKGNDSDKGNEYGEGDEYDTLLLLSLQHGVPLRVLREWNPHLTRYSEEDAIPSSVIVTVPRAHGLDEDLYEDPDEVAATLGGENGITAGTARGAGSSSGVGGTTLEPSSVRSRASTSSTVRSSTGSPQHRVRDNVRFVSANELTPRNSSGPPSVSGVGSPPLTPLESQAPVPSQQQQQQQLRSHHEQERAAAVSEVSMNTAGTAATAANAEDGEGLTDSPMASPRDWRPTPAPPPPEAVVEEYRRASLSQSRDPLELSPTQRQQQQQQQSKMVTTERRVETLAPKYTARAAATTPTPTPAPARAARPPPPPLAAASRDAPKRPSSVGQDPGPGRGKLLKMPPPLVARETAKGGCAQEADISTGGSNGEGYGSRDMNEKSDAAGGRTVPQRTASRGRGPSSARGRRQGSGVDVAKDMRAGEAAVTSGQANRPATPRTARGQRVPAPPPLSTLAVDYDDVQRQQQKELLQPQPDVIAAAVVKQQAIKEASKAEQQAEKSSHKHQQQQPQRPTPKPAFMQQVYTKHLGKQSRTVATAAAHPATAATIEAPPSSQQQQHSSAASMVSASRAESNAAGIPSADPLASMPPLEWIGRQMGPRLHPGTLTVAQVRGPAARAGFRVGDAIRTVDGKAVRSIEELAAYAVSIPRQAVFVTVQEVSQGPVKTRHVTFDPVAIGETADVLGGGGAGTGGSLSEPVSARRKRSRAAALPAAAGSGTHAEKNANTTATGSAGGVRRIALGTPRPSPTPARGRTASASATTRTGTSGRQPPRSGGGGGTPSFLTALRMPPNNINGSGGPATARGSASTSVSARYPLGATTATAVAAVPPPPPTTAEVRAASASAEPPPRAPVSSRGSASAPLYPTSVSRDRARVCQSSTQQQHQHQHQPALSTGPSRESSTTPVSRIRVRSRSAQPSTARGPSVAPG